MYVYWVAIPNYAGNLCHLKTVLQFFVTFLVRHANTLTHVCAHIKICSETHCRNHTNITSATSSLAWTALILRAASIECSDRVTRALSFNLQRCAISTYPNQVNIHVKIHKTHTQIQRLQQSHGSRDKDVLFSMLRMCDF